jgi:hypothetical protein
MSEILFWNHWRCRLARPQQVMLHGLSATSAARMTIGFAVQGGACTRKQGRGQSQPKSNFSFASAFRATNAYAAAVARGESAATSQIEIGHKLRPPAEFAGRAAHTVPHGPKNPHPA